MQAFLPKSGAGKKVSRVPFRLSNPHVLLTPWGHENGRFRSDHSVVIKDRPRLRGPLLRVIFEAKNAANGFDAALSSVTKNRWPIKNSPHAAGRPTSRKSRDCQAPPVVTLRT